MARGMSINELRRPDGPRSVDSLKKDMGLRVGVRKPAWISASIQARNRDRKARDEKIQKNREQARPESLEQKNPMMQETIWSPKGINRKRR